MDVPIAGQKGIALSTGMTGEIRAWRHRRLAKWKKTGVWPEEVETKAGLAWGWIPFQGFLRSFLKGFVRFWKSLFPFLG